MNLPHNLFIGRNISAETKSWLAAENISFEEHSFIRIEYCQPNLFVFSSEEKKPKHFVVSSGCAAKWLVKFQTEIGFKKSDSIFCLSEKQKEICNAISENIFVATHQNALSLARLVFKINRCEPVVYLHGNLSLNIFENEMKSLGVRFQKAEVYRNEPVLTKLEKTFGVYLFFSPSGAENFVQSGNQIPRNSTIAAIGPTTANACEKLFGREIMTSEKQKELDAVQFAAGLLQQSGIRLNTI
jgi:uroporphyrinogen-III synthase